MLGGSHSCDQPLLCEGQVLCLQHSAVHFVPGAVARSLNLHLSENENLRLLRQRQVSAGVSQVSQVLSQASGVRPPDLRLLLAHLLPALPSSCETQERHSARVPISQQ